MNNMYKRCIYCGEQLYSDENRCRTCRKWQNKFDDSYGQPPQYDERYENLGNYYPDDNFDRNNDRYDRYSDTPHRQLAGVEIGAIVVIVVLVGVIIGLLLCR